MKNRTFTWRTDSVRAERCLRIADVAYNGNFSAMVEDALDQLVIRVENIIRRVEEEGKQ